MSTDTSVDRYSFVATFELIADGQSIKLAQIAPDFVILDRPVHVAPGSAELIIHFSDRPDQLREIEVLGPDPEHPDRLLIRR